MSKRKAAGLDVQLSETIYKTGQQSLNVKTSGNLPASPMVQQVLNIPPQTEEELNSHIDFVDVAPYLLIPRVKKESPTESPLLSKSKPK